MSSNLKVLNNLNLGDVQLSSLSKARQRAVNSRMKVNGRYVQMRTITPGTIFPDLRYKFSPDPNQLTDIQKFCDGWDVRDFTQSDRELTEILRSNAKMLGRLFPMASLKSKPMLWQEDGLALLLPYDNTLGEVALTYKNPLWWKLIKSCCRDFIREAGASAVEQECRVLLTDYSWNVPYSNMIRQDGRMELPKDGDELDYFSLKLCTYFKQQFIDAGKHLEDFRPRINGSKSLGFWKTEPNGEPVNKEDYVICPKRLYVPNGSWNRYDFGQLKVAYMMSEAAQQSIQFFLDNCARYSEPEIYLQAVLRKAASVHTEGYRINNSDGVKNDKFENVLAGEVAFSKSRIAALELDNYQFGSGVVDNRKYCEEAHRLFGDRVGAPLKKRPIFPGPNEVFSFPFILLFRVLSQNIEELSSGFPSNRECVLRRYNRFFDTHRAWKKRVLAFDRTNSEQFITDNFSLVRNFFKAWAGLQNVVTGLATATFAAPKGPRVVNGALPSGTPPTTFLNMCMGLYEAIRMVSHVFNASFDKVCDLFFEHIINETAYIAISDNIHLLYNMGTDDQVMYIAIKSGEFSVIAQRIERYTSNRYLSYSFEDEAKVFGLHFTSETVEVAKTSGLSKWPLIEKTTNGDAAALKMWCRLMLIPEFLPIIAHYIEQYTGGHISCYSVGGVNYLSGLGSFGISGLTDLFNQYNPTEQRILTEALGHLPADIDLRQDLYLGKKLIERGYEMGQDGKYPLDLCKMYYDMLYRSIS